MSTTRRCSEWLLWFYQRNAYWPKKIWLDRSVVQTILLENGHPERNSFSGHALYFDGIPLEVR